MREDERGLSGTGGVAGLSGVMTTLVKRRCLIEVLLLFWQLQDQVHTQNTNKKMSQC